MAVKVLHDGGESYSYPLLVKHLLRTPLQIAPEQEIVYRNSRRYTYRTLAERVSRLASALTSKGLQQGKTVAIMDWDSHRYLECYFAIPMLGAILQTVNVRLSPDQILYTLNHAQADVLIINREFIPMFEEIRDKLTSVRRFILIDEEENSLEAGSLYCDEYESLLADANATFDFPDFDENAIATTFYTTGTTGLPKGVCFTHRQLVLHTITVLGAFSSAPAGQSFRQGDVYMPITPMFHVHAWGFPYIATVLGVKQVYPGRYDPNLLLDLKQKEGVTYSHCVPTILQMLLDAANARGDDLKDWKMTIGGSALSTGLLKAALNKGMDIFAAYGMSETGPVLTVTRVRSDTPEEPDASFKTRSKTGLPIPLVDIRIVDESMNDIPHDGVSTGELVVRAPWLTACYVGDADASRNLWHGGYLHTQDIAVIDQHGYIQVTDRLKDVIKSGGEWISSLAIEDILSQHPSVAEAAVVGIPDPRWGERPVAFVVTKGNVVADELPHALRKHVSAYVESGLISKFAIPDKVVVVESLKRTSVGKLDKKTMRQTLAR